MLCQDTRPVRFGEEPIWNGNHTFCDGLRLKRLVNRDAGALLLSIGVDHVRARDVRLQLRRLHPVDGLKVLKAAVGENPTEASHSHLKCRSSAPSRSSRSRPGSLPENILFFMSTVKCLRLRRRIKPVMDRHIIVMDSGAPKCARAVSQFDARSFNKFSNPNAASIVRFQCVLPFVVVGMIPDVDKVNKRNLCLEMRLALYFVQILC